MSTENAKKSFIIKLDGQVEQTVGEIVRKIGVVSAVKFLSVIDTLDLTANPRSSKTGPVTEAIQETLALDREAFPVKSKGILLAASGYEELERNRLKLLPDNLRLEGILDGGHNTLAIGLFVLKKAMQYADLSLPKKAFNWDEFKALWVANREIVEQYVKAVRENNDLNDLDFYIPVEVLVPKDPEDSASVTEFKNRLFDICEARNNNAELSVTSKTNQKGYFEELKNLMEKRNPALCRDIVWKTNTEGNIKATEFIAQVWIPLMLCAPVHDENGKVIEIVAPNKLYSSKGSCLKQFERLMDSPDVTAQDGDGYQRKLVNEEIRSAFRIAVELPELYDYIYTMFPSYYNAANGKYRSITVVKKLNEKTKDKKTPFTGTEVETLNPEGYIIPLIYGLRALMGVREENGQREIVWTQAPMPFLQRNLKKIVEFYSGMISTCAYDPQKVGKNPQSYEQALAGFKMAVANLL